MPGKCEEIVRGVCGAWGGVRRVGLCEEKVRKVCEESVRGAIVLLKNQSDSEARHDIRPGPPSSQAAPERDFNPIFCIQVDLYGPSVSRLGNEH